MTAEQLRNSILQEAISGRLVPQNPNDEPASALLARIREEKARLVKEGKLKKKDLVETPITDDEKPFEIPSSWEWVRVKELFNVCSARRVHEKDWRSSGIPFYRAREIGKLAEFGHVDNDLYIDQELYNEFSKSGVPQENDLMVTAVGTLGRVYVVKANEIFYYKDGSVLCMENRFGINAKFAKLVIESPVFVSQYIGESQGTTVATLTMVRMNEYLFPLPPLAEQKRIVAKLEELLPIVEQYGKAQKELDELNAALPARLRQSILQEAISGRLVPQDSNDEPATALLQRIREEKARLVKAKQISKRDFEVLPITEDDVDYEIPTSWEWVRLGDIFKHSTGKALNEANKKGTLQDYITTSNVYWGYFKLDKLRQMYYTEDEKEKCMATKGDLLVLEGGDVGRAAIWDRDYDIFLQNHIHKLRAYVPVCTEFYYYCLYLFHDMGLVGGKGIGIQGLSSGALHQIIFPLPPLAEQKRIVAKIEELLADINKISK